MANQHRRSWLGSLFASVDRFLFAPGDPTTLGLVRICGGLIILYVHIAYTADLYRFFGKDAWVSTKFLNDWRREVPYGPYPTGWDQTISIKPAQTPEEQQFISKWGMHPADQIDHGLYEWSAFFHITEPTAMMAFHIGALICMLCLAVGFCTRITAVLTWIAMLSYIHRAPNALFGMDTIIIIVAMYLMIGPSGAALSVDRWIATHLAAKRSGRPWTWQQFLSPPPQTSATLAIRLLQIHACFIYGASGLSKLQGSGWWAGTAVWGTMANYEFSPMTSSLYMEFLRVLCKNRPVWEVAMTALTYGTLIFEVGFPFLVWSSRFRWTMLAMAVGLHLGIAFFMGLVTFSMIMLTAVLSFVPPDLVRDLFARIRGLGSPPQALSQAA